MNSRFNAFRFSLLALPACALVQGASAQAVVPERAERGITVIGQCTRPVVADRGALTLTAEFTDRDLRAATKKATEAYEHARDAIKKLGLGDLELRTSEYQLAEWREWEKSKSVFKGYRARMGAKISTSSIERLGEVIAVATREGLTDVGSLTTFLSDEKLKKEQFACLQTAAENARAKADRLASSLGAKVTELSYLNEGGNDPARRPVFDGMPAGRLSMTAAASSEIAPPMVEAGRQDINLSVQVTFKIE